MNTLKRVLFIAVALALFVPATYAEDCASTAKMIARSLKKQAKLVKKFSKKCGKAKKPTIYNKLLSKIDTEASALKKKTANSEGGPDDVMWVGKLMGLCFAGG